MSVFCPCFYGEKWKSEIGFTVRFSFRAEFLGSIVRHVLKSCVPWRICRGFTNAIRHLWRMRTSAPARWFCWWVNTPSANRRSFAICWSETTQDCGSVRNPRPINLFVSPTGNVEEVLNYGTFSCSKAKPSAVLKLAVCCSRGKKKIYVKCIYQDGMSILDFMFPPCFNRKSQ